MTRQQRAQRRDENRQNNAQEKPRKRSQIPGKASGEKIAPNEAGHEAEIGVDYGTGYMSAGGWCDGKYFQVPLGEHNEGGEGKRPTYRVPVGNIFTPTCLKLLGLETIIDYENTSRGLKQALDIGRLCKNKDGQGAIFRRLANRYSRTADYRRYYADQCGATELDEEKLIDISLIMHFEHLWKCITEHAEKEKYTIKNIRIAFPMMWYEDEDGEEIRQRVLRCAVAGGFPEKLDDESEETSCFAYIMSLAKLDQVLHMQSSETVVMADFGAGTTEVIAAKVRRGHIQVLRKPVGDEGGMNDVEALVVKMCQDRGKRSTSFYKDAINYLYHLKADSEKFEQDGVVISADDFRKIIRDNYEKVIKLLLTQIQMTIDVTRVILLGVSVSSNDYLAGYLKTRIEQSRRSARFTIEPLSSEIARKAVHLGAATPFEKNDPLQMFKAECFGILFEEDRGTKKTNKQGTQMPKFHIIETKKRNSVDLERLFDEFIVDDPNEFTFEPHTFLYDDTRTAKLRRRPLASGGKSWDTFRPVWSPKYALSMGTITLDLGGRVDRGGQIGLRFVWTSGKPGTLITLEAKCPDGTILSKNLELCGSRYTVYLKQLKKANSASDSNKGDTPAKEAADERMASPDEPVVPKTPPRSDDSLKRSFDSPTKPSGGRKRRKLRSSQDEDLRDLESEAIKDGSKPASPASSLPTTYLARRAPDRWTIQNPDWQKDWHKPLVFAPTGKLTATVDSDEIERLDDGGRLNDELINFYEQYLWLGLKATMPGIWDKVCVCSTFFFETLRSIESAGGHYADMLKWLEKDFFSYDYVLIPIHEAAHWYLAIICNMSNTVSGKAEEKKSAASADDEPCQSQPPSPATTVRRSSSRNAPTAKFTHPSNRDSRVSKIITLDSLGRTHQSACDTLIKFIVAVAKDKGVELAEVFTAMAAEQVPKQSNDSDCGVFVLGYIERFLKDPHETARRLLHKESVDWDIDPSRLRVEIRDILFKLQAAVAESLPPAMENPSSEEKAGLRKTTPEVSQTFGESGQSVVPSLSGEVVAGEGSSSLSPGNDARRIPSTNDLYEFTSDNDEKQKTGSPPSKEKITPKKASAKKASANKTTPKKASAKKASANKTTPKKASAKEPTAQEPPAKESPAKEPPAKEPPAKEPPAQEPLAKKPPAKEPTKRMSVKSMLGFST